MADAHFNLGAGYTALNEKQAALEQYRRLQLLDEKWAKKLYGVIYKDKLLVIRRSQITQIEK